MDEEEAEELLGFGRALVGTAGPATPAASPAEGAVGRGPAPRPALLTRLVG
jgi:hypothetical protein